MLGLTRVRAMDGKCGLTKGLVCVNTWVWKGMDWGRVQRGVSLRVAGMGTGADVL